MKVLFVGEGPHDIGHRAGPAILEPQPAAGVVPTLARRACPAIGAESVALRWTDIPRFQLKKPPKGLGGKVAAAILLSQHFDCQGTICVHDRDRHEDRHGELLQGRQRGLDVLTAPHACACGVAVESIDAWTLGAREAIAAELGLSLEHVAAEYPTLPVEDLYEQSGKEDHQPKALLQRLAALAHHNDSADLRQAIAARTDVDALARTCPRGFGPFLQALREGFLEGP